MVEKPFGHDKTSAIALAHALEAMLESEELYLMDHYMGKPGVLALQEFQQQNANFFTNLWNTQAIKSIEVN